MTKLVKGFSFVAAVALLVVGVSVSAQTTTFTRDLTIGSTGADVVALQDILIAGGYLAMPAGVSKGYFGTLTKNAVMAWQAKMALPATGYFGPMSRAAIGSAPSTPSTPGSSSLDGGDGDFSDFDLLGDPSNEDVEEGEEVNVLGFEFEADDSDLLVERLDLQLSGAAGQKPWKYIEEVKLYSGDDEVASVDASDSDAWDETSTDDRYEITISDIDTVVEEGDTAEFYVAVVAVDSNDDLPITWTIRIATEGLRAVNAEGINVYEGDVAKTETFTQEVATEGELDISVDEDENEAEVVEVDEDSATNDVVLYTATVDVEEGDNLIEEIAVQLTSGTANLSEIVKSLYVLVDGDEVGKESTSAATTATTTFEDIDLEVEEDDEITIEIVADIRETDNGDNYVSGETIYVNALSIDYVDGQDDDQEVYDGANGGTMTLSTSSVMVDKVSTTATEDDQNEAKGKFTVKFKVTAPSDEDIYIPLSSATTSYAVYDAETGSVVTITADSAVLTGGTLSGAFIKIAEGNSKDLTLTVNLNNTGGATTTAAVRFTQLSYKVGSTSAATTTYTSGLDEDFQTDPIDLGTYNVLD